MPVLFLFFVPEDQRTDDEKLSTGYNAVTQNPLQAYELMIMVIGNCQI